MKHSNMLCACTAAKQQFPGVDFGLIESDEDVLWKEHVRESYQEKQVPPFYC